MLCSEAILVNQGPLEGHATILRCKRWSCEICRPYNHRRIKRAAREGQPTTFLTLTVNPANYVTWDDAARDLKNAWVNVRRRMQRGFAIDRPPFIAIFESTKTGWPHLHILMRCRFIPQRWFSAQMKDLIGAPIVDVRYVPDTGRIAAYVSKYVSKAPEGFKGSKRWWRSKDYQVEKEEGEPFKRFSPYVHEFSGKVADWLWKAYGNGVKLTEARDGYWKWRVLQADNRQALTPWHM